MKPLKSKGAIVLILLFLFISSVYGQSKKPVLEITTTVGCGFYVGSFLDHLKKDGALTVTPTVDTYISSFFTPFMGFQFQIGGGSVINPASEPMEGVLIYLSAGPFVEWNSNRFSLKSWAGFGFEQASMTLQWYGSGFWEAGLEGGIKTSDTNGLVLGLHFRRQFLRSIIIYKQYDSIDKNDNLSSITLATGWRIRL